MDLIFLLVAIFDGMIVGMVVSAIATGLFGDSPLARLLRLILTAGSGIGYFILCTHLCWGDTDASIGTFLIIILLPIGFIGVAKVIDYMFKK